ncbi:uncharacterized protein Tco025E_05958 [Trypanosoma conorhini]|uniref:Uncharacterized protein n=1 Tax=Trypanosoma conorhini TaxID=83891 RepID=A0A422P8P7_9TRYP|nr:uncharacterized protein Tco025E_05958 [Trypanosoma conorhini]RNF14085.1 hypothetical protein Tco025E_05958 [Trypanosoma conorhini]
MAGANFPAEVQGLPGGLLSANLFVVCLSVVLLCSVGVVSMGLTSSLSSNYLEVTNSRNVVYNSSHNGTVEPNAVLLIPEFAIDIGMLYFTIGVSFFSRKQWNVLPLPPFYHREGAMQPPLPEDILLAYLKARKDALQFGYATAEACGGDSAAKIMYSSRFVFAATVIGTLCGLGIIVVVSVFFFHLRKQVSLPKAQVRVKQKCLVVRLTGEEKELKNFIRLHESERRWEHYVILVLLLLSVVGTVFLVTAEVVERHLHSSALKCGRPFCSVYEEAMASLLRALGVSGHRFSCQVGYSSVLLFVVTILNGVLFLLVLLLAALHFFMSHTTVRLTRVRKGTERQPGEGGELNPICSAYAPRDLRSPYNDNFDANHSVTLPKAATSASENGRVESCQFVYSTEAESDVGEVAELKTDFGSFLCRQRRALAKREEVARGAIYHEHQFVFCTQFFWMRQKLWLGELLCMLHLHSINCYLGRILDLQVKETYCRQTLLWKNSAKLLSKLRGLEKEGYTSEAALRGTKKATALVRAAGDEVMCSVSHYAVKDGSYRCQLPTEGWLNSATKAVTDAATETRHAELACGYGISSPEFSLASADMSSSETLQRNPFPPFRLDVPLDGALSMEKQGTVDKFLANGYAKLIQDANRPIRLRRGALFGTDAWN